MPTVIGFLWPWAINTVFSFFPSLCWSQSYETLASPHLHIYCIGLKSGEWLMWSLPSEFLAVYYYERHGGGLQHVSVILIKVEEDRIMSVPHLLPFTAVLNPWGQELISACSRARGVIHSQKKKKKKQADSLVKILISVSLASNVNKNVIHFS